jgi:L-aspartate oxidase
VRLDLRHLDAERVRTRFPRIHATCLRYGVDITVEPVPVTPAAHYVMGGVATDLSGRSSLPGLYAAGEVAGTGVHGANRLASNSLLEGLVFGARAAEAMLGDAPPAPPAGAPEEDAAPEAPAPAPEAVLARLRDGAWGALGLEREADGLRGFLAALEPLRAALPARPATRAAVEARNVADVAGAMARCALFREESRGGHFRRDFPRPDDARFGGHTLLEGGTPRLVDADLPPEGAAAGRPRSEARA